MSISRYWALALILIVLAAAPNAYSADRIYEPNWASLDQRPNPTWFENAKFGIFIHWGVYSVPAWGPKKRYAEWYWHDMMQGKSATRRFHDKTYGADMKYTHFADDFKAEMYEPAEWAELFRLSGARYVVLTSKHHDGYCLWPSAQAWNWNSVDVGPGRELAGDLSEAVKAAGLRFGFYYSLYEWFNPLYLNDVDRYVEEHMLPQMKDLVQRYQPDLFWPDGEWSHPSSTWRSTEFLAWLFNESDAPDDIAINDRWGKECRNVHGGFATPEYGGIPEGHLVQAGRFEECQGMGHSFGYNRNEGVDEYRSSTELLHLLIDNVSRGGNLLLDIGPTADGRIPVIMQQRLADMGAWLEVNGEAIYGTERWDDAPEVENVRFTEKGGTVYAILFEWPGRRVSLPIAGVTRARLLGYDGDLEMREDDGLTRISLPAFGPSEAPCDHAWTIALDRD